MRAGFFRAIFHHLLQEGFIVAETVIAFLQFSQHTGNGISHFTFQMTIHLAFELFFQFWDALARYLLGEKCGNRLKTIDELANECRSSVGLTQAALKTLESSGAIRIERRGRNGSYLVEMDNKALLTHVDINNVVCAMPLPYTRLYEGLASGLKAQFDGIPFYYAHMRGADIRVECLLNGVYDMAVVSRLAAESYLTQKGLCLALELGPHTYVGEHQLICRKGESANVKRVGLDNRSADQKIMTDVFFWR